MSVATQQLWKEQTGQEWSLSRLTRSGIHQGFRLEYSENGKPQFHYEFSDETSDIFREESIPENIRKTVQREVGKKRELQGDEVREENGDIWRVSVSNSEKNSFVRIERSADGKVRLRNISEMQGLANGPHRAFWRDVLQVLKYQIFDGGRVLFSDGVIGYLSMESIPHPTEQNGEPTIRAKLAYKDGTRIHSHSGEERPRDYDSRFNALLAGYYNNQMMGLRVERSCSNPKSVVLFAPFMGAAFLYCGPESDKELDELCPAFFVPTVKWMWRRYNREKLSAECSGFVTSFSSNFSSFTLTSETTLNGQPHAIEQICRDGRRVKVTIETVD